MYIKYQVHSVFVCFQGKEKGFENMGYERLSNNM